MSTTPQPSDSNFQHLKNHFSCQQKLKIAINLENESKIISIEFLVYACPLSLQIEDIYSKRVSKYLDTLQCHILPYFFTLKMNSSRWRKKNCQYLRCGESLRKKIMAENWELTIGIEMETLFVKAKREKRTMTPSKGTSRIKKFWSDEKRIVYWRGLLMDVCQWLLIIWAAKAMEKRRKVKVILMLSDIFRLWKDFPNGIWKVFLFQALGELFRVTNLNILYLAVGIKWTF